MMLITCWNSIHIQGNCTHCATRHLASRHGELRTEDETRCCSCRSVGFADERIMKNKYGTEKPQSLAFERAPKQKKSLSEEGEALACIDICIICKAAGC